MISNWLQIIARCRKEPLSGSVSFPSLFVHECSRSRLLSGGLRETLACKISSHVAIGVLAMGWMASAFPVTTHLCNSAKEAEMKLIQNTP